MAAWTLMLVLFTIIFVTLVQGPMLLLPTLSILFPSTVASAVGFHRLRWRLAWDKKTCIGYGALAGIVSTFCLVQYPGRVLPFSILAGLLLGPPCSLLYTSVAPGEIEVEPGLSRSGGEE